VTASATARKLARGSADGKSAAAAAAVCDPGGPGYATTDGEGTV
jgi:hypothetical protein